MAGSGNAWFSIERVVAFDEPETELPAGCNGFKRGSEDVDGRLLVMEVVGLWRQGTRKFCAHVTRPYLQYFPPKLFRFDKHLRTNY